MTATTNDRPLGVREDGPANARFRMYPDAKLPAGDGWAYIADDFGLAYRRGWWPFRSADGSDAESVKGWIRKCERQGIRGASLGKDCGWRSVRMSPDTGYGSGGYVTVFPDLQEAWKASADLDLHVRPQGLGAITAPCTVIVDLRDMTATVHTWPLEITPLDAEGFSENFPAELRDQAAEKRDKIVAFLRQHTEWRDAGKRKIETAHDRWIASGGH